MNQKSKNNLLSSIEDFFPQGHTSVMKAKLFFPHPKEWIWIIQLLPKPCSVHPDDIKSEGDSQHSEKSPDPDSPPSFQAAAVHNGTVIPAVLYFSCCCSYSSLHLGNPSLFLTCILEGLSQGNRTQQNTAQSNFPKKSYINSELSLFSLRF